MENMKWQKALHSFVSLKEGISIQNETVSCFFKSNNSLFQSYGPNLVGLTGTTGSTCCFNFLSSLFGTEFIKIPTFRWKRFHQMKTWYSNDQDTWFRQILEDACAAQSQKKAILIIMNNIKNAARVKDFFRSRSIEVSDYVFSNDQEQLDLVEKNLKKRQIVVATNLAGRGTDFTLTQEVLRNGGLHVILTFFPRNSRVEKQALGRSARQGQKGTARLIVNISDSQNKQIFEMLMNRFEEDEGVTREEMVEKLNIDHRDEFVEMVDEVRYCLEERQLFKDFLKVKKDHEIMEEFLEKFIVFIHENKEKYDFEVSPLFDFFKDSCGEYMKKMSKKIRKLGEKKKIRRQIRDKMIERFDQFMEIAVKNLEDPKTIENSEVLSKYALYQFNYKNFCLDSTEREEMDQEAQTALALDLNQEALNKNPNCLSSLNLRIFLLCQQDSEKNKSEILECFNKKLGIQARELQTKLEKVIQVNKIENLTNACLNKLYKLEHKRIFEKKDVVAQRNFKKKLKKNIEQEILGQINGKQDQLDKILITHGMYSKRAPIPSLKYDNDFDFSKIIEHSRQKQMQSFLAHSSLKGGLKKDALIDYIYYLHEIKEQAKIKNEFEKNQKVEIFEVLDFLEGDEVRERENLQLEKKVGVGIFYSFFSSLSEVIGKMLKNEIELEKVMEICNMHIGYGVDTLGEKLFATSERPDFYLVVNEVVKKIRSSKLQVGQMNGKSSEESPIFKALKKIEKESLDKKITNMMHFENGNDEQFLPFDRSMESKTDQNKEMMLFLGDTYQYFSDLNRKIVSEFQIFYFDEIKKQTSDFAENFKEKYSKFMFSFICSKCIEGDTEEIQKKKENSKKLKSIIDDRVNMVIKKEGQLNKIDRFKRNASFIDFELKKDKSIITSVLKKYENTLDKITYPGIYMLIQLSEKIIIESPNLSHLSPKSISKLLLKFMSQLKMFFFFFQPIVLEERFLQIARNQLIKFQYREDYFQAIYLLFLKLHKDCVLPNVSEFLQLGQVVDAKTRSLSESIEKVCENEVFRVSITQK